MRISEQEMIRLAKELDIKKKNIPFSEFKKGVRVELEHGPKSKGGVSNSTNVTKGSLKKTAKIAQAHLLEDSRYYKALNHMEKKLESTKARNMSNGKSKKIFKAKHPKRAKS